MPRPTRPVLLWGITLIYLAWMLGVGLWSTPVDSSLHPLIVKVLAVLHRHGLPEAINYGVIEFTANIGFFVPIGILLAVLLPKRMRWVAVLAGVTISGIIELSQLLLLSHRYASWGDILANSIGTGIGVLLMVVIGRVQRERPPVAG